jgi:peptide/nickel transport system substrate-binding protein
MMTTGRAHVTDQYLSPQAYNEIGNSDAARVYRDSQPSLYHMMMNTKKEPFDDIDVRRAFNLVFDAQSAVENIWGGGSVANGPVPSGLPGKNEELSPYGADTDAAADAISQSSYTVDDINAIDITVIHPAGFANQRRNGLLLQNSLKEIDINIGVSAEQWPSITGRVTDAETAPRILSSTATASVPTPDAHTYQMHHPSQLGTYTSAAFYSTDELTQVLDQARTEPDRQKRYDLYREAQQLIVEGYPSVYVCYTPFRIALNNNVGGFSDLKLMGASHQFHNYHWK